MQALPVLLAVAASRRRWGPPDLQEVCVDGVCHRFGKISTPLDHDDPSQGSWDLTYFVNSDFWDPANKPHAPIFINMGYGSTTVPGWTSSALRQVDGATFSRGFVGTSPDFAREMGALIINVPNRYYGCETARAGRAEGCCPTSLEEIPRGEEGVVEARDRLQYLSLKSVVDDIAFVAQSMITTLAADWGMTIPAGRRRASNQPIVFGCSWPGAAATYARMLHPEVFPGAVATSHPLVSSPEGNNHYRSFVGEVYELYSAGGSLECRNVLSVGHEEIRRRIHRHGTDRGPTGSCEVDCIIAEDVNRDFGRSESSYYSFGGGVPGLPGVQTINRDCTTLGCNIETTCDFLLDCFDDAVDSSDHPFPISSHDRVAAEAAYGCLVKFTAARTRLGAANESAEDADEDGRSLMVYNPQRLTPSFNLGPIVYESNTLTYQMFGFKGPLWMTQTCNDGSGCPFVQGKYGGASYDQINARLWASYAKPSESLTDFVKMMQSGAREWHKTMGGQRPWTASDVTNVYMVYNDADPWTGTGAVQHMPAGRDIFYDLGGGGVSHCVYPGYGAQQKIREWAGVPESAALNNSRPTLNR